MAIISGLIPPSRENWELISKIWQLFPLVGEYSHPEELPKLINTQFTAAQWMTSWYPMGKTSIESRFNIPGRIGWFTMEAPGFILLLYIMNALPKELGLDDGMPISNWALAGMFVRTSLASSFSTSLSTSQ